MPRVHLRDGVQGQNAVRIGGYIYGAHGNLGPAFFTAVDAATGRTMWRHRGFGKSSLIYADGKAIIIDEDGDLALATLSPEGMKVLSQARISTRFPGRFRRWWGRRFTRGTGRRWSRSTWGRGNRD